MAANPIVRLPAATPQTWIGSAIASFTNFISHKAFPWIETFLKGIALDEIHMLAPLATEAAAEIVTDIPLLFGEPGKFMGAVHAVATSTFQKAEAQGLQVAETSVLTAAQAAVHNLIAAAPPTA